MALNAVSLTEINAGAAEIVKQDQSDLALHSPQNKCMVVNGRSDLNDPDQKGRLETLGNGKMLATSVMKKKV